LKIWDLRSEYSVNTLLDKKDPSPLRSLDWSKRDDWIVSVGTFNGKISIWDVRNPLQPMKIQQSHDLVKSVKFDTIFPDRLVSCGKDRVVRVRFITSK
jgi:WD40 repeat protein